MSNNSKITKVYTKFEPNRIHFTDLEENKRSKGQKIAYVRYNDKNKGDQTLLLQTPQILLDTYGLPKKGDYYTDEKQRSFIKVPLDQEIPDIKIFHDKLTELDDILDSDEMRIQIFGSLKKSKGWKYQTIIREPVAQTIEENSDSDSENDDATKETETANTYPRPSYMKAKFNLNFDTGDITTKMFKLVDGQREKVNVTTLESVEQLVTFRSTVRLVLMPNKLWAMKAYDGKKYGMTFKIMHLEVVPVERTSLKQYFDNDAFVDSDDEDSEEATTNATATATTNANATATTTVKSTLNNDDSDEDNVPTLKTSALDLGNDSDESDNSDSDSDESEEEVVEVKPTKKTAPKGSKKKKVVNATT